MSSPSPAVSTASRSSPVIFTCSIRRPAAASPTPEAPARLPTEGVPRRSPGQTGRRPAGPPLLRGGGSEARGGDLGILIGGPRPPRRSRPRSCRRSRLAGRHRPALCRASPCMRGVTRSRAPPSSCSALVGLFTLLAVTALPMAISMLASCVLSMRQRKRPARPPLSTTTIASCQPFFLASASAASSIFLGDLETDTGTVGRQRTR